MTEENAKKQIETLCDVSRETMGRLQIYADLLERWNPKINLVSKPTLTEKWNRHFLDSAQVWPLIPKDAKAVADVGSGAGFAGLVLAIIAAQKAPNMIFTLIESDARKCAFMRNVAREAGVAVQIETARIESVEGINADVMTARALATVTQLLKYSQNILTPKGVCLFLKGDACDIEIEQARESWTFNATKAASLTHPLGKVLTLTGIDLVN